MISEKHAPPTSIKQSDTNKSSGVRKQWTRLEKIVWPVAPDGYIPNSVVRSLAPYPQFKHSCANRGLQIKEQIEEDNIEQKRLLKYFLEKYGFSKEEQQNKEDEPEEKNITPSLINKSEKTKTGASLTPHQRAVPQSQNLLQNKLNPIQQNASSVDELQTNASSVDDIQMKDSSVNVLQTNASSVEEQKTEEEESLSEKSNAFSSKQPKNLQKVQQVDFKPPEALSVSPKLQEVKDELHQEMVSTIKEQKTSDSANKSVHVLEIGAPKQTMQKKADSPFKKKLKAFVSPLPLLGNRRPHSALIYLYKRSKAEKASEGVKQAPKVA